MSHLQLFLSCYNKGVRMVTLRFIMAVVSIMLQEAAIAILVLYGLPEFGVRLPVGGLIGLMAAWLLVSSFLYQIGSRALSQRPYITLPNMVGGKGKVVSPLIPDGLVSIKGELWIARSASKKLDVGAEVIAVEQDGLKLVVREITKDETE